MQKHAGITQSGAVVFPKPTHDSIHTEDDLKVQLQQGRIASIDVFRALTILAMIMVNEWHGVVGIPAWLKHMPASADALSFADLVFPAFLFIVGMSLPIALQHRSLKGETVWARQGHIAQRFFGLLVLGLFMVNAESGAKPELMLLPMAAWALLSYLAAFLVWGSIHSGRAFPMALRAMGVALFLLLAYLYVP